MKQPQVTEGTPNEIQDHLKNLNSNLRLMLIVPAESEDHETSKNLYHATPEERARALDAVAAMNQNVPVLPPEAYNRESLYEETFS